MAERPARARLFERLQLDYCCGGRQTLAEACAKAHVQLDTVRAALQKLSERELDPGGNDDLTDWRTVETERLCQHIVDVHHDYLRRVLPRIRELTATVVRVHADKDPELHDVRDAFGRVRSALEPHLAGEELDLFPAILAAERDGSAVAEDVLAEHEREHAEVGATLAELRVLCHDYDRERAHCNTHRALLDALEELERDLHRHVHEENNVLLPRARAART